MDKPPSSSSSGQDSTSSPVGVLEDYFRNVETDSTSSKDSESDHKQKNSRWRVLVQKLRTKSKRVVVEEVPPELQYPPPRPAPGLSFLKLSRLSSSMRERIGGGGSGGGKAAYGFVSSGGLCGDCESSSSSSCKRSFSFSEIQSATNNFSQDNLIGKGGYAEVYKGRLQDGRIVAVKRLMKGTTEERIADFLTELGIMAHVDHPNTSKLIGYGFEGGMMHLVLEYSPLGSLASHLHGVKERIGWQVRYKVAIGIAEGLKYLHEECQRRIIHRDIKAANILLTRNFEPQICDFGLAKWLPEKWTHHTVSKFEGTFGYLAPEYLMHGIVDEKTDVFAFGVLLLELITGRRALDCSQQSLVLWAKPLLRKSNNIRELIDPELGNEFDIRTMNLMLLAASLCVQRSSIRRPTISQVLQLLKGNISSLDWKKTRKPTFWKRQYDPDTMTQQQQQQLNRGVL